MDIHSTNAAEDGLDAATELGGETTPATHSERKPRKSLSMHANVPAWYDCCSCEAEPYWLEAVGELDGDVVDRDPACEHTRDERRS